MGLPMPSDQENTYSLLGQDSMYGQHKNAGVTLSNTLPHSVISEARKSERDSRASVTSNGPPSGIPLSEALSMKGYTSSNHCIVGPAVPPRTPLNEALHIKGFSQMSVSEGDSASSTKSLVREAEMDVKRMLKQKSFSEVRVEPGTPLNEALAQKGIVSAPPTPMHGSLHRSMSSRSGSVPVDEPEDHYNVPRNNQPAFFPENGDTSPHYKSPPRSKIPEDHYQSPRSLKDDSPNHLYNVLPPPRPAPAPRTATRKMRSTLLRDSNSEGSVSQVNGAFSPPTIDRSSKPRPPPINRSNKPGRSESFDLGQSEIPQMTEDSVHYVSLQKLTVAEGKPVPRPRANTKKTDYSQVDLDGTLAMEKKFTIEEEEPPQVPERTKDSLDLYSSDDSTGSDDSYTNMRVSVPLDIQLFTKVAIKVATS